MRADAGATRERIVAAARTEFATYGLAGARVDRISANAQASKERLYAYFGDKDSLFRAALEDGFTRFVDAVPFTVDDLGAFAGRAYRHLCSEADEHRILLWAQLQGEKKLYDSHLAGGVMHQRIEAVAAAQADGLLNRDIEPQDLMTLVFGIVSAWVTTPGQDPVPESADEIERRSAVIEAAVRRLTAVR